jgi:hypothetical protein
MILEPIQCPGCNDTIAVINTAKQRMANSATFVKIPTVIAAPLFGSMRIEAT